MKRLSFEDLCNVVVKRGAVEKPSPTATAGPAIGRLRKNCEDQIAAPLFDRRSEIARAGPRVNDRNFRLMIVVGNYLLRDRAPWRALRDPFRTTVMIDANMATLRDRVARRWVDLGIDLEAVRRKIEGIDLPNAEIVMNGSASAELSSELSDVASPIAMTARRCVVAKRRSA